MAGGVAELAPVGAAHHVDDPPQRLARDRHEHVAGGATGHLRERMRGVGDMLEDLDRRDHVELAVAEGQLLGALGDVGQIGLRAALPLGREQRVVKVDPDDAPRRKRPRPALREDALAAADVEQRLRLRRGQQVLEVALEPALEQPRERVAGVVLVVGVAGDGAIGRARDGRHGAASSGLSSSLRLPLAEGARSSCAAACASGACSTAS